MVIIVIIVLYVAGLIFMMMADGSDALGTANKFMRWSLAVVGVTSVVAATVLLILLGLGKLHV